MSLTPLSGLLILDKPEGITSMTAVSRVKRRLGIRKAGHTGTLDPLATGVLPICLGQATRIAEFLLASEKIYRATLRLGITTDTCDADGQILQESPWPPSLQPHDFLTTLQSFAGDIMQTPPVFSALKIQGRRAYELARAGVSVDMTPRPITIHRISLEQWDLPWITIACEVSKGTYIRSLVRDIGEKLGCGAHLTALRRLQAGKFSLDQAVTLEQMESDPVAVQQAVIPLNQLLHPWPTFHITEQQERLFRNGAIPYEFAHHAPLQDSPHSVLSTTGQLLALIEYKDGLWHFLRVFGSE